MTNKKSPTSSNKKSMFYTTPVAIDADGKRAFCDVKFNKLTGKFTIIIPQDFLDQAKYPVRIEEGFYTSKKEAIDSYRKIEKK